MGTLLTEPALDIVERSSTRSQPASPSAEFIDSSALKSEFPRTAVLIGFDPSGEPLVSFKLGGSDRESMARSCVPLGSDCVGREVVLLFDDGDPTRPIILGLIQLPANEREKPGADRSQAHFTPDVVEIDGDRVVFSARTEIVLRCGDASIVLTRAGKILIRGAYLLNRSTGVNMIQGGSVQIN